MIKREFIYSVIEGLEQDVNGARESLARTSELDDEFTEWAKEFPAIPIDVLKELYQKGG